MEIKNILKQIGLTPNEIEIYIITLQYGSGPASIISKRSAINRGTTYSVLKTLLKKGLLKQSKKALGTYFTAVDPELLLKYLDEKKDEIDKNKEVLKQHLDEIKKFNIQDIAKPQVTFYEGVEGIKQIHEDILKCSKGNTIHSFIPQNMEGEDFLRFLFDDFIRRRIENKISIEVIAPESEIGFKILEDDKKSLRKTKIVSKENCTFESEVTIYEQKIAMISYKPEEMIGLIVESPSMSKTMKQIFQLTWNAGDSFIPSQKELFG